MPTHDEFLTLLEAYKSAVGKGDHEAVSNLFADNAVLLEPGMSPVVGKTAIRELYQDWLGDGVAVNIELQDSQEVGDTVYGWGTYESGEAKGNWLEVLHRQKDGQLLIHRLCTNQV